MPHQVALTLVAQVRPGEAESLQELLGTMGDGVANGSVVDFGALDGVHFARFVVLDEATDLTGETLPASLLYMCDLDVSRERHLGQLVDVAGEGLDRLFEHCEGYPEERKRTRETRLDYLRRHRVKEQAFYVNTVGRTRRQIREEAELRDRVEDFLDGADGLRGQDPAEIQRAVRKHVEADRALSRALSPPAGLDLGFRLRELAHLVGVALLVIVLLPLLLLSAPVFLVLLRRHERRDRAQHVKPPVEVVQELAALEDHVVMNPFTALGFVKPGLFRRVTLTGVLYAINYVTRHVFNHGNLAGVKTIHFARWVFLDDKRRVIFASNYDGSLESYMDDFIDKIAWGLNIVFSNGYGYPNARFLILDGCHDELAFKDYLRLHQVPTRVWFSAYEQLSCANIANNARIRAGLRGEATEKWVQALWSAPELNDVQGLIARGYGNLSAARFLLVGIDDAAAGRAWLGGVAGMLTTAEQSPDAQAVNIALTRSGLAKLGVDAATVALFANEFADGMTAPHRTRALGDIDENAPEHWDWGGPRTPDVDAVLLLYARDEAALAVHERQQTAELGAGLQVLARLDTSNLDGHEPFGNRDGISQPYLEGLSKKGPPETTLRFGEFVLGYPNEYGRYTDQPLLDARPDLARNGSYLVFRQLRQDVHGFWRFLDEQTKLPDGSSDPERRLRLAAKMVGRWPSGAPLALAPESDDPALAEANDFAYFADDPHGVRCPLGSHIRRANPRDSLDPKPGTAKSWAINRRHRILRRGREYGQEELLKPDMALRMDAAGPAERGLHFICLNANIARQFEFVNNTWLNSPKFAGLYDDADPLVAPSSPHGGTFTVQSSSVRERVREVPRFVSVRGGAYFFMPGLAATRYLSRLGG